jgi:enoyl-[acyl-carrier-protein] reductase (NADH)
LVTDAAESKLTKSVQDWGLSAFSEEKQAAHQEKTKLKQLITVDDVAQQVLCFVKSRGVTGANAIIDAGASI